LTIVSDVQPSPDPEEIRREIVQARENLGDTVEALARKADVKGRAKEKIADAQDSVKAKVSDVRAKVSDVESAGRRPVSAPAVAGLVAGFLVVGWLLARR
jgi:hypothetical protein